VGGGEKDSNRDDMTVNSLNPHGESGVLLPPRRNKKRHRGGNMEGSEPLFTVLTRRCRACIVTWHRDMQRSCCMKLNSA
jgi:hypothetical protein